MHEYSIVQALINQCEGVAREHEATTIVKVVTKIGAMSGGRGTATANRI